MQREVQDAVDTGCQHLHYAYMYIIEYEVGQDIQQQTRGEGGADEGPLRHRQSDRHFLEIC